MITEDYVRFETAKLLKEKGFDEPCSHIYRNDGMHLYCGDAKLTTLTNTEIDEPQDWVSETFTCACPTLQMAMKWLRDNYGFHIAVEPLSFEKLTGKAESYIFNYWFNGEYHIPYEEKHPEYHKLFAKTWEKYEEACEAAIKYCLENLI